MLDHLGLQARDVKASLDFYLSTFAAIGIHPGYYGVFLRDPDGHNVEAVHHG
ncbi:MAG: hypothetical protein ACRDOA_21220 [Streptosporangiaceae bacterium]